MTRTARSLPDGHRHPAAASPLNAPKPVLSSSPAGVCKLLACRPIAATRQPSLPRAPSTRTPGLISMLLLAAESVNPVRMNPGPPPAAPGPSPGIPLRPPPPAPLAAPPFDPHPRANLDVFAPCPGPEPRSDEPRPPPRRIRQLLRDYVDHPAHGIGAVKNARGPANQLDTTRERRFDRGAVLITPRVILEPAAVLEHEHPWPREAANHRFPDLRAGAERAHAGQRLDDMGERDPLSLPLLVGRLRAGGQCGRLHRQRLARRGYG